ncbi:MAG: 23S rRNA (pseudouridine(1915)-N(3))-methyltransferase RlmH [Crocinitomicaceae bacterium]|nr:23S rRNA (pseudouridine(1915)-N(3))-methyltransferase RlmH [Crocinitomicaceae bacterium]
MKITILCIGKTLSPFLKEGTGHYLKRLSYYAKTEYRELPDITSKGLSPEQLKEKEGEVILKYLKPDDTLVLLDDKGKNLSSEELANWLQKKMNGSVRHLVLAVGGAFGFSPKVYERAEALLSFSKMTFSHEMIRLILVEQLYRAHTILKGEKYHHP